jgi:hypothetical protein
MVIVSTKEFRDRQKKYFDLAEDERVLVKRGKKFLHIVVSDKPDTSFVDDAWLKDFFSIPEEYRCNPFEISPSGDLFWADKRNVALVREGERQIKEGKYTRITNDQELETFLDAL